MLIPGWDYHPGAQQIAFVHADRGELQEPRLPHREQAEKFYRDPAAQAMRVRVGMEARGRARWLERLLAERNIELWTGDAAKIRAKRVALKKTDRQDARHILKLMLKDDFSKIWVGVQILAFVPPTLRTPQRVGQPPIGRCSLDRLLAGGSTRLRVALVSVLTLEIESHSGADEILQGRLIDHVALMEVDRAPDVPLKAGVE